MPMYALFYLLLLLVQSTTLSVATNGEPEVGWTEPAEAIANFTALVNAFNENASRSAPQTWNPNWSGTYARDDDAVEITFPPPELSTNVTDNTNETDASLDETFAPVEANSTDEAGGLTQDEGSNSGDANLESGGTATSSAAEVRVLHAVVPWVVQLSAALLLHAFEHGGH